MVDDGEVPGAQPAATSTAATTAGAITRALIASQVMRTWPYHRHYRARGLEAGVKIRFGIGLGADTGPEQLAGIVDDLEASGVDSLWFSELVYTKAVDPFVGMAFALARTTNLKVGTSVAVLPGRHPVLVAKQLASLAGLAPKRVLPVFGLRSAIPAEREIFVVPDGQRAAVFDESLQLLRSVLEHQDVAFAGDYFAVTAAGVQPRPVKPLDIWLGGSAPAAFRRIGQLGDGWLGSFVTADEARRGREQIQRAAEQAGREIEPDHFGINLAVSDGHLSDAMAAAVRRRRPDVDPTELICADWPDLHRRLDAYLEAGLTKFVIRPAQPARLEEFVDRFVAELLPRQN